MDKRTFSRVTATFPVELEVKAPLANPPSHIKGETVNISKSGMELSLERSIPRFSNLAIRMDFSPRFSPVETDAQIIWSNHTVKEGRFRCGLRFIEYADDTLGNVLREINRNQIEDFFGVSLPDHIKESHRDDWICREFKQQEIM